MEINYDIWDKAIDRIKHNDQEREFLCACKLAGICPKCGGELKLKIWAVFMYVCSECNWIG